MTNTSPDKASPPRAPLRVLMVEDSAVDAEFILIALKKGGFQVSSTRVESAEEFTHLLRTQVFDVILSDYKLPQWNGMEALATLQAEKVAIPFILVTGSLGEETAVECLKRGAKNYILKDRLARLPVVIQQALEERALQERRAEAEATNALLRAAIEQSTEAVMITSATGEIQYVNPAFSWMTGYGPEEVLGQNPRLLQSGQHSPSFYREMWEVLLAGNVWQGEIVNRRKDGGPYTERMTIAPVQAEGAGITHYIAVKEDVTERKRAEEALQESEERYRTLVEQSQCLICTHDLEGRLLSVNSFVTQILGYDRAELVGRNLRDVTLPSVRHLFEPYLDRIKQHGSDSGFLSLVNKAGEERILAYRNMLLEAPGKPPVVLGVALDLTERRRAEQALRVSEQRLKLVLDATNEGVWDWNIKTGEVYYSPRYAAALGYTPKEIPPNLAFWERHVHPEDMPRLQELLQAQLDGKTDIFEYEYRIRKKDGTWRWTLDHGKVVEWDEDGKPARMVGSDLDITGRKLLEEQLQQAQKMEAIGRLAGGVAHDFNNVIGVILGYSDLLLETLSTDDSTRRRLEEVKKAAERASGLTRQLLAFSRQQVLQPQVVDLNAVVKDMDKMLRRLLGEDIELVSLPQPKLGRVKADPGQLEQVIMNLAINARDAMPQGGKLTLETDSVELDERYARQHHGVVPGSYVLLAVSDTGEGMDRETQARIFDPFFTTKEKGKGTGLGLATVYGIVKQSGGHVWVYSEPGQGTTFKVYLPRVHEEAEQAEQLAEEEMTPPGTETILLVEDEEGVRNLSRELLQTSGYQVLEAKDGASALRLEKTHTGPIHLLMTDVVMPGMSGRELAEKLTLRHPEMKVLYVSGYTDNAIVHHGVLEAGMHFLQKPFTLGDLARKLRQVMSKGSAANKSS